MKHRPPLPLSLLALLLLAMACASPKGGLVPPGVFNPSASQVWQLTELRGKPLDRGGHTTTLVFNPKTGYLHGSTACNTYSATYTLGVDQSLHIGAINRGGVSCPDPQVGVQNRYLATLLKADRIEATATTLTLFQSNRTILKFELQ